MKATATPFDTCIAALIGDGPHRVWSLIVSLFGDMAQDQGAEIAGMQLSRITEPMGVKPQALRVALHRLRKDGWIDSRKLGRRSLYHLTTQGLKESAQATPRIYAPGPAQADSWHILIQQPLPQAELSETAQSLADDGYVPIARNTFLKAGPLPAHTFDCMALHGPDLRLPKWLRQQIGTPELAEGYDALLRNLTLLSRGLERMGTPTPLECATLRTLIVHDWRRMLLRHPDLPPDFFPEEWQGEACRAKVHDLLSRLPRPDLAVLADLQDGA